MGKKAQRIWAAAYRLLGPPTRFAYTRLKAAIINSRIPETRVKNHAYSSNLVPNLVPNRVLV